jgi:hypothetical protein
MIYRLLLASMLVLLNACASISTSKSLTCSARGVTISAPDGWSVSDSGCHFKGPDDVHLVEINPSAESSGRTLGLVSAISGTVLKVALNYEEYGTQRQIKTPNFSGIQRTYKDQAGRNIVQLVIEKDGRFWQLMMQTPMKNWNENKDKLLRVLYSTRLN